METLSNTMEGRIRQIMEAKQMSQKEFAECTNISPASLSSIFNGRTRATNNHTLAIHQAFPDVNINWLLFGEGSMYGSNESASDIHDSDAVPESPDLFGQEHVRPQVSMPRVAPEVTEVVTKVEKPRREVKEIRVFFDDGTYESFVPQK